MREKGSAFDLKAVPCSGIAECEMALLKLKVGKLEGNFIEGMACEGGCVQGAGCLVRSPRNRLDVEKHAKQAEGRDILDAVRAGADHVPGDSTGEQVVPVPRAAKGQAAAAADAPAPKKA